MSFPVILQKDTVTFNCSPEKGNGIVSTLNIASWMTPYGFVIPTNWGSTVVLGCLLEGSLNNLPVNYSPSVRFRAFLYDVEGYLKEVIMGRDADNTPQCEVCHISYDSGEKHVFSTGEIEEHVTALFSLDWDSPEIVQYLQKNTILHCKGVKTVTFETLDKCVGVIGIKKFSLAIFQETKK